MGHALETVGTRNTRDDRLEDLLDQIGLEALFESGEKTITTPKT